VNDPILLASRGSIVNVKLSVFGKGILRYKCSDSTTLIETTIWLAALS
jgi:hypothetical protein